MTPVSALTQHAIDRYRERSGCRKPVRTMDEQAVLRRGAGGADWRQPILSPWLDRGGGWRCR